MSDGSVVLVAVIAFAFQLYTDFSGYSDIAVGSAKVLGIDLVRNFRQPYFSRSIAEFWRRWHISLSTWFRDYVYYPLVWNGRSWGAWWVSVSVLITFSLIGLWHGAGWHYLVMGLLFGFYICFAQWTKKWRTKLIAFTGLQKLPTLQAIFETISTFCLAAIAFIFFRAESLTQGLVVVRKLFTDWGHNSFSFLHCSSFCANYVIGVSKTEYVEIFISLAILFAYEFIEAFNIKLPALFSKRWVRWPLYYSFLLWILIAGNFVPKAFIYFKF